MKTTAGILVLLLATSALVAGGTTMSTIRGEVAAVDVEAGTVTVNNVNPDGSEQQQAVTFTVDDKTMIEKAGQAIQLSEVQPGDRVTVKYKETEGTRVALQIGVQGDRA